MELSRAVKGNIGLWRVRIEYGKELNPKNIENEEFDQNQKVNLHITSKNNNFKGCNDVLENNILNTPLTVRELVSFHILLAAAVAEMKQMGLISTEEEQRLKTIGEEGVRKLTL